MAIEDLKAKGVIQEYAVFGAVAQAFWDEAIPTFDLDILVLLSAPPSGLISLDPLYRWAEERGYRTQDEHIFIGEIPVQIVPAPNQLHVEAVETATSLDYDGKSLRVVTPEYLVATWLQPPANTASRRERAAKIRESGIVNLTLLSDLMTRFGLSW